jgi:60kDa lysophospholipase
VLVIYTGGTIGMLVGHQGYVPEPYFLTETLRSQARFHDPEQNSLFSNSGSVQGFRKWNTSGRASPSPGQKSPSTPNEPTLLVRSSRSIGLSGSLSPEHDRDEKNLPLSCHQVAEDIYEANVPSLVTPKSTVHGGTSKSIRYAILEVSS